MFRKDKDITERTKSSLKNKEVRLLRQRLATLYPSTTPASWAADHPVNFQEILPEKGNVSIIKLMTKTLVYSVDQIPYFFDLFDRNDLYPTIFALFRFPSMLRPIIIYEPVSEFLLNGADLMLPGVAFIPDLHTLSVGEKVCIRVAGNPIPFAIGKSEIDGQTVEILRQDQNPRWKKGKCVAIVQIFGDLLWQQCRDRLRGIDLPGVSDPMTLVYPNSGFSRQHLALSAIEPEPLFSPTQQEPSEDHSPGDADTSGGETQGKSDGEEETVKMSGEAGEEEELQAEDHSSTLLSSSTSQQIPAETMDSLLMICLLRTLKYLIKDKDLPMLTSAFWSIVTRSILPTDSSFLPEHCQSAELKIDIKHSSYKKTLAFLKHLQAIGLLSLITDRVASVNRQHEFFREFKDQLRVENSDEFRMHVTVLSGGGDHSPANDPNSRLKIIDLFKFPRPLREVLMAVVRNGQGEELEENLPWLMGEGSYGECMTHSQVQWLIATYVSLQNLQDPNERSSLIVPTTSPLYSHLCRLKALQKEKDKAVPKKESKKSSNSSSGPSDDFPPEASDATVAAVTEENEDQLYQMVGGVLVMPLHRPSAASTPPPATVSSQDSKPIHTPFKWKPVSLPPAPPPQSKLSYSSAATAAHPQHQQQQQQRKPKKEKSSTECDAPEDLQLTKEDLMFRLKNALVPYHALLLPTGEMTITAGAAPKILIEGEMRSGNKVVTRMSGVEIYGLNSQLCAREFQKKFACSATAGPVPTRPKDIEIVVQGNWISELEEYLKTHCNVPSKLIETKKLQKKPKK